MHSPEDEEARVREVRVQLCRMGTLEGEPVEGRLARVEAGVRGIEALLTLRRCPCCAGDGMA